MSQNELALSFFNMGFFNPQLTDQALATLDMMDFDGKYDVMSKIQQNGTMQQELIKWQQMALMLASKYEPQMADGLAQAITGGGANPAPVGSGQAVQDGSQVDLSRSDEMGIKPKEHAVVDKARAQSQNSTRVNA